MLVASCIFFPFSTLCDDMLNMLVCATRWLSMHLYTFAYMSMHEYCLLVCCPCFNTMKLWTFDPNLHLSLTNTSFCSLSCLFTLLLVCLPFCLFACFIALLLAMPIMPLCFMPFHMLFALLPSITCLLVFLSLPLHVHTWSANAWS